MYLYSDADAIVKGKPRVILESVWRREVFVPFNGPAASRYQVAKLEITNLSLVLRLRGSDFYL
jgi:hypothetical protein